MRGFTVSQALLFLSCLLLPTSAANVLGVHPRADSCVPEIEDIMTYLDGTTTDGAAGLGFEFECPLFYFVNNDCSLDDTNAAKKQAVGGRTGTNFMLTADTGHGAGKLSAEYILDGTQIKIGDGQATTAGEAVMNDLIAWQPWQNPDPRLVDIENSNCNPWTIGGPPRGQQPEEMEWQPQVTKRKFHAKYSSDLGILDGAVFSDESFVLVRKSYFQSKNINMDHTTVTNDVLAFCSLVLSYAKTADFESKADKSPKLHVNVMPRTEFTTIFKQVQSKFPTNYDLFTIFNYLACYETNVIKHGDVLGFSLIIDKKYCSGAPENPIPNDKFANLEFKNEATDPAETMNIKEWIEGIGALSPVPDLLTTFDASIDGSIGGLGTKMERMYNSPTSVPLFEFRGLDTILAADFKDFMGDVDILVQELHNGYNAAQQKVKRQAASGAVCNITAAVTSWQPMSSSMITLRSKVSHSSKATPSSRAITSSVVTLSSTISPSSMAKASSTMVVTTTPAITSMATTTTTSTSTISCSLQEEDPDVGINSQGCVCDGTTLPVVTSPKPTNPSGSCYYTALPRTSVTNPINITTATYTSNCKICKEVGGIGGVAECTSTVPSCTPTVPGYSTMTAHFDTSSVHLGVLNTATPATAVMTNIKSAVETLCPSIALGKSWGECNGNGAVIDNVDTVVDQELMSGSLNFTIGCSNYTSDAFRELMLSLAVASFTQASYQNRKSVQYISSTISYMLGDDYSNCPTSAAVVTSPLDKRRDLESRQVLTDETTNCYSNVTVCNGPSAVFVQLEESDGSLVNWLSLDVKFVLGKEPDWLEWVCDLIDDLLLLVMNIVDVGTVADHAFLGPELEAVCDCFQHDDDSQCPF